MKEKITLDLLGICMSFLCMIHCLAMPLLLILGVDSLLWTIDQEWIELAIILASLLIGSGAFYLGYRKHQQHTIPVLFIAGFLLLVNGESVTREWVGLFLSPAGAAIIAYAHFQNLRWQRTSMVR